MRSRARRRISHRDKFSAAPRLIPYADADASGASRVDFNAEVVPEEERRKLTHDPKALPRVLELIATARRRAAGGDAAGRGRGDGGSGSGSSAGGSAPPSASSPPPSAHSPLPSASSPLSTTISLTPAAAPSAPPRVDASSRTEA